MSTRIILEVYRGPAPDVIGRELDGATYARLDDAAIAWLTGQGYSPDNPDVWVNVAEPGEWAPNNHPVAELETNTID